MTTHQVASAFRAQSFKEIDSPNSLKKMLRELYRAEDRGNHAGISTRNKSNQGFFDIAANTTQSSFHEMDQSQARLTSQELFLSVVFHWQKYGDSPKAEIQDPSLPEETIASKSKDKEKEKEKEDTIISPRSVHNIDQAITPLRLDVAGPKRSVKRIGIYSPRSRKQLLLKYKEKRSKRLLQTKVSLRYHVRKNLANARPRIRGRFVKTDQPVTAAVVEALS